MRRKRTSPAFSTVALSAGISKDVLYMKLGETKPFLILQMRPEDETADNEFEAFLTFGGIDHSDARRIRVESEDIPSDVQEYSAIIAGGSPFDVCTPLEDQDSTQRRVTEQFNRLFDVVVQEDMPFLGACSGIGLLGNYCGALVSQKYSEPVGGVDVYLTKEGQQDPLLQGVPETFRALVGHKEACEQAPSNGVLLASSATCPVQMFRIGENVYATQFHPEADATGFKVRIDAYKHHGYFSPADAELLKAAVEAEDTPVPKKILRRFADRYRAPQSG